MSVYCTAPFNSLTIRENGQVRTCCPGLTVLGDCSVTPISDIINNQKLKIIKKTLLNGHIPKNCRTCTNLELNKNNSMREFYNTIHPDIDNGLQFLDIRWNTLCNLNCIYCNEEWSSKWAHIKNVDRVCKRSSENNNDLLSWVLDNSSNLKEIMLVGGEPLLMKQNYQLLSNLDPKVKISIITNLSCDIEKNPIAQLLINKFGENVVWTVSLENVGKKLEYVRHGISSNLIEKNIKLLTTKNLNVTIQYVYGIFSSFDLVSTICHYSNLGIEVFNFTTVKENEILDIFNYPKSILEYSKVQLTHALTLENQLNLKFIDLSKIYLRMKYTLSRKPKASINTKKFLEEISNYDKFNSLEFSKVFQDEYKFILENLPN